MNRRNFLKKSTLASVVGATGIGSIATGILNSCNSSKTSFTPLKELGTYYIPELPDKAVDGKPLKIGIVGCGGRGSGAIQDFLRAADNLTITALGDVFKERVESTASRLKNDKNIDVPAENQFVGLGAYKKVIDSDVDVIIDTTPPVFRPLHFQYAVEKNKHLFLEKPICVDAVGYRTIMAAAKQATAKGLSVITGTQRHHQRSYVESYKKVMEGYIGEITGGTVYWNQNMLWYRERQKGWSDVEYMIKDWVNWKWLSGDHIVEQHCHNIDVFMWFSGLKPVKAVGFGSRQRRVTGDQYDNFSIDFTMENGIHLHSMSRQIDGCANNVSEYIQGTKGCWNSADMTIKDLQGNLIWQYDFEAEKSQYQQTNPYTLEIVNLINSIRKQTPIEQATETARSSMASIMGRESAYTGSEITWDAMTAAPLDYMPKDLTMGNLDMKQFTVPVPGSPQK